MRKAFLFVLVALASCQSPKNEGQQSNKAVETTAAAESKHSNNNPVSGESNMEDANGTLQKEVSFMWRLHKTTTQIIDYNYNYDSGKRTEEVKTRESFANANEFLNLLDNRTFELKEESSSESDILKGNWLLTFGRENGETFALLHLRTEKGSFDDDTKFNTYLLSFEKSNNVNFLVLERVSDKKTSYYLKQQ